MGNDDEVISAAPAAGNAAAAGASTTTPTHLAASQNTSTGGSTATAEVETAITTDKPVKDDDTVPEDNEAIAPITGTASATNKNNAAVATNNSKKMLNLRFLFANRDGLSVSIQCDPADTVGEVKGALISMWPKEMPACTDGDDLRLICMGKGLLSPDSKTLADLEIPSFKSHSTPVNVSVRRPEPLTKQQQLLAQQQQQQQSMSLGNVNSNNPNGNGALVASLCCTIQ